MCSCHKRISDPVLSLWIDIIWTIFVNKRKYYSFQYFLYNSTKPNISIYNKAELIFCINRMIIMLLKVSFLLCAIFSASKTKCRHFLINFNVTIFYDSQVKWYFGNYLLVICVLFSWHANNFQQYLTTAHATQEIWKTQFICMSHFGLGLGVISGRWWSR